MSNPEFELFPLKAPHAGQTLIVPLDRDPDRLWLHDPGNPFGCGGREVVFKVKQGRGSTSEVSDFTCRGPWNIAPSAANALSGGQVNLLNRFNFLLLWSPTKAPLEAATKSPSSPQHDNVGRVQLRDVEYSEVDRTLEQARRLWGSPIWYHIYRVKNDQVVTPASVEGMKP